MSAQALKPSDLRIGNHCNWRGGDAPDGGYDIVFEIKDFVDFEKHPYRFRPIPLTEEWLLRFSYKKDGPEFKINDNDRFSVYEPNGYDHFVFCDGLSVLTEKIKYVHQLQNLYHALTGEELEIKI